MSSTFAFSPLFVQYVYFTKMFALRFEYGGIDWEGMFKEVVYSSFYNQANLIVPANVYGLKPFFIMCTKSELFSGSI